MIGWNYIVAGTCMPLFPMKGEVSSYQGRQSCHAVPAAVSSSTCELACRNELSLTLNGAVYG